MDQDAGLTLCTARPEFTALSENDVLKAILCDTCAENPITAEVTRLGVEFMARFKAYVEKNGGLPASLMLHVEARCPIEKIAIMTVTRFMETQFAPSPATVH